MHVLSCIVKDEQCNNQKMEAHIAAERFWQNSRLLGNIVTIKFILLIHRWGNYSVVGQNLCNKELYLLLLRMIYVDRWKKDGPFFYCFYMESGL